MWTGTEVSMVGTVLSLLVAHFIGDYVLQSDKMALGKSKGFKPLVFHIFVYSIALFFFAIGLAASWKAALSYVIFNGLCHMVIDFVTSRAASYEWANENRHNFFVILGLDQLAHQLCLIFTIPMLSLPV
jgi:membrane-bound metal-dependent hydrolase YbcI (DUF457 family)